MGVVIRNSAGNFVAAMAKPYAYMSSAGHAEALATWEGLCFASLIHEAGIVLEGDSLAVVNAVTSHNEDC